MSLKLVEEEKAGRGQARRHFSVEGRGAHRQGGRLPL